MARIPKHDMDMNIIASSTAVQTTCPHVVRNWGFVVRDRWGMRRIVCADCLAFFLKGATEQKVNKEKEKENVQIIPS